MVDNEKDRALTLLNRLWRDVEGGAYGNRARICKAWSRDKEGYWAFKQWFSRQPVVKGPVLTKDFLKKSDEFSPETCVLVPRQLHSWIVDNFIASRPLPAERNKPYRITLYYSGERKKFIFDDLDDAKDFVREKSVAFFSVFEKEMSRTIPNFMVRMSEFVEAALNGIAPFHYFTRDGRRKHGIKATRNSRRVRKDHL